MQRILSYNNLAYHLHLLGDETAIEFAETGLALAREKGVIGLQAYLFSTLGEIALAHRNLDLAHQYFSEGLEIAERYALRERIAGLTANQGLVVIQQGKIDLAIFHLSRALGLADALGTQHLAVQIRIWLAPLLPADEGRLHLQEARGIAESSGRLSLLEEIMHLENQQKY
jgi:hypothetical protein